MIDMVIEAGKSATLLFPDGDALTCEPTSFHAFIDGREISLKPIKQDFGIGMPKIWAGIKK